MTDEKSREVIQCQEVVDKLIEKADARMESGGFKKGVYGSFDMGPGDALVYIVEDLVDLGYMKKPESKLEYKQAGMMYAGVPALRIMGGIFETMPDDLSPAFPGRFFRAARDRDLRLARPRFYWMLMADPDSPMYEAAQHEIVREEIERVVEAYKQWLESGRRPKSIRAEEDPVEWRSLSEAESSAREAGAEDAAWAAYVAYGFARNRIYFSEDSSDKAAMADLFIKAIRSCPELGNNTPGLGRLILMYRMNQTPLPQTEAPEGSE